MLLRVSCYRTLCSLLLPIRSSGVITLPLRPALSTRATNDNQADADAEPLPRSIKRYSEIPHLSNSCDLENPSSPDAHHCPGIVQHQNTIHSNADRDLVIPHSQMLPIALAVLATVNAHLADGLVGARAAVPSKRDEFACPADRPVKCPAWNSCHPEGWTCCLGR